MVALEGAATLRFWPMQRQWQARVRPVRGVSTGWLPLLSAEAQTLCPVSLCTTCALRCLCYAVGISWTVLVCAPTTDASKLHISKDVRVSCRAYTVAAHTQGAGVCRGAPAAPGGAGEPEAPVPGEAAADYLSLSMQVCAVQRCCGQVCCNKLQHVTPALQRKLLKCRHSRCAVNTCSLVARLVSGRRR